MGASVIVEFRVGSVSVEYRPFVNVKIEILEWNHRIEERQFCIFSVNETEEHLLVSSELINKG